MFRRNKQKTNRNSLIESILWNFLENFGLFLFVSKQFCLLLLFRYRFETPNYFVLFSLNKPKPNRNRSCFGLFRFEPNFMFVSMTPQEWGLTKSFLGILESKLVCRAIFFRQWSVLKLVLVFCRCACSSTAIQTANAIFAVPISSMILSEGMVFNYALYTFMIM